MIGMEDVNGNKLVDLATLGLSILLLGVVKGKSVESTMGIESHGQGTAQPLFSQPGTLGCRDLDLDTPILWGNDSKNLLFSLKL